jgi:hypothetical protein
MLSPLFAISARCRQSWLIPLSTATILMLSMSQPSLAQCSALDASGNATCNSGGNPYAGGINFNTNSTPINVTFGPGVQVVIPAGSNVVNAVGLGTDTSASAGGPATLIANDAAITINTATIVTQETAAIRIQSAGNAIIGTLANPVTGIINVTGTNSTNAIWANVFSSLPGAVASVVYSGPVSPGINGITETGGPNSTLIQACANDNCGFGNDVQGDAEIDAAGNLKGVGNNAPSTTGMNGLFAEAGGGDVPGEGAGDATVNYHQGTIDITQSDTGIAAGIFASSGDVGSATITTDPGTTVKVSGQGSALFGIDVFASGGDATANVASTILIDGSPTTTSSYRRNPTGIIATTDPNAATDPIGSVSVTYSGPGITVHGGGGLGIVAVAGGVDATTASGSVAVNASGPIVADGSNAVGILADSGTVRNLFRGSPSLPTTTTGAVQVTAGNVSAQGQFGVGINATAGSGGVAVNIPSGG